MSAHQIKITGKVQGVFFRTSARDRASQLGLTGFVTNLPDGSVYIEASGKTKALNQFLSWCKKGPKLAKVSQAQSKPITNISQPVGNNFLIL